MICQECADNDTEHTSGLCQRCRDKMIEELKCQIRELESDY